MIDMTPESKDYLINSGVQVVTVRDALNNEVIGFEDFRQGGLTINRTAVSGEGLEIGSAVAAEASFTIDNSSGKFDDVNFEGMELVPKINIGSSESEEEDYLIGSFTSGLPGTIMVEESELPFVMANWDSLQYTAENPLNVYIENDITCNFAEQALEFFFAFINTQTSTLFLEINFDKTQFTEFHQGSMLSLVGESNGTDLRLIAIEDIGVIEPKIEIITIGHFFVDEIIKQDKTISLIALDGMVKFDKPVGNITYPARVSDIVDTCCTACGISLQGSLSSLPNYNYYVSQPTSQNLTYRQLLAWCCQIMGACAFINANGKLEIKWYSNVSDNNGVSKLTKDNRYQSTVSENNITITGVGAKIGETIYMSGTDDYAIIIEGNELINTDTVQTMVANIGSKINGFTYRPVTAETLPLVWLQPLDCTKFTNDDGTYNIAITDWTYKINSSIAIESRGESSVKKGYASQGAFTPQQSAIIEHVRQLAEQETDIDDRTQAVLKLNTALNNGLALHITTYNGQSYYHDASTLANSTYIATANSGGFAFTSSGWNNGSPIWEYGISADGNAVMNALSAYKISADIVQAGIIKSISGTTQINLNNDTISFANGAMTYGLNGNQIVFNQTEIDTSDAQVTDEIKNIVAMKLYGVPYNQLNFTQNLVATPHIIAEVICRVILEKSNIVIKDGNQNIVSAWNMGGLVFNGGNTSTSSSYGLSAEIAGDLKVGGSISGNTPAIQSGVFEGKSDQTLTLTEVGMYRLTLSSTNGSSVYVINYINNQNALGGAEGIINNVYSMASSSIKLNTANSLKTDGTLIVTNLGYAGTNRYCLEKLA